MSIFTEQRLKKYVTHGTHLFPFQEKTVELKTNLYGAADSLNMWHIFIIIIIIIIITIIIILTKKRKFNKKE